MRRLLVLFLGLVLAGCDSGVKRVAVVGNVMLDGEPVAEGNIVFLPGDADSGGDGARIVDGEYRCEVTPGAKRIRITADRRVPGPNDRTGMPRHEQYIPARYNRATTLKASIEQAQSLDFPLTSK